MLAHWFSRVGSIVAPDDKAEAQQQQLQQQDEDFWQFLAPDPRFQPPPAPPSDAFPNLMDQNEEYFCIECEHCHRSTRLPPSLVSSIKRASTSNTPTTDPPSNTVSVSFQTPSPSRNRAKGLSTPQTSEKQGLVDDLVLSAAKDTAMVFGSPQTKSNQKLFSLCANTKELKPKKYEQITKWLTNDPNLLEQRSINLGQSCPDGYTLLMATAHSNHVTAAMIIMDTAKSSGKLSTVLDARTWLGKSALHIASETGSMDMVDYLGPFYHAPVKEPIVDNNNNESVAVSSSHGELTSPNPSSMPLDLLGRTPLGTGILSPDAKKYRKALKSKLLTEHDESIFGIFTPYDERMGSVQFAVPSGEVDGDGVQGGISYGIADMPGMRIEMEDSICKSALSPAIESGDAVPSYFLLGVCDGHGDHKAVSEFVARTMPSFLEECIGPSRSPFSWEGDKESADEVARHWTAIWSSAALRVDDSLRAEGIPGGSTGVFALINRDSVVVANVGDSRCILIQTATSGAGETASENEDRQERSETVAVALSEDHKPDLPNEKARIENAGLEVESITFSNADGSEEVIHKVRKSETDKLGVSRSFGDFEYKCNTALGPHEQAVSCDPDVVLHKRDPNRDLYLVLCCDGIFDVMSNDGVKDFVMEYAEKNMGGEGNDVLLPQIGDALCRKCFDLGSEDNMSVVIVSLQSDESPVRKTLAFTSP